MQSRGTRDNKVRQFKCRQCGKWEYVPLNSDEDIPSNDRESKTYEQGRDFINVVLTSRRVLNEEDIIKEFNIDTTKWEIDRFKVKTSEGYRKDRSVDWEVENGVVLHGEVHDSGKMLIAPMYHISASFIRKTQEIRSKLAVYDMLEDARTLFPRYPKIEYPKQSDGVMYEIAMPDAHYGLLTWGEETGDDYDIKIAKEKIMDGVTKLLQSAQNFPIEKILLPIGNDLFNVNSKDNTTVHGTPQQEDTRWQKTFKECRLIMTDVIDLCSQIAPVDVLIVPGNHDEERTFYLGDSLDAWYHSNPQVSIDNSPKSRKYYLYGQDLVGFAHGYYEPIHKLPLIMASEAKELWSQSTHREWHLGDKHHKKDMLMLADEGNGMMIRILRSISPSSAWTFNKGFLSLKACEGLVWHKSEGVIAQFTVPS